MKIWINGEKILSEFNISSDDLVYYIDKKQITAHQTANQKKIDWSEIENNFNEIRKLSETPVTDYIRVQRRDKNAPAWSERGRNVRESVEEVHFSRLSPQPANLKLTNGVEIKTERVPWNSLLARLKKGEYEINIPCEQEEEIIKGWNHKTKLSYALEAIYLREEIERLYTIQQNKKTGSAETITDLLVKISDEIPIDLKSNAKGAITKSIKTITNQLPKAFELCFMLAIQAKPNNEDEDWKTYSQEEIIREAEIMGIKTPTAKEIFKGLPDIMRRK